MKYVETKVCFSEIPDEISLCISISNCPGICRNCHSPELREDIGSPLDWGSLNALIHIHKGITCVCLLGGDRSPEDIDKLAWHIKKTGLKAAWYSGLESISPKIDVRNFDYIKTGPYIEEKGPLTSKTTNQRLYRIDHCLQEGMESFELIDITNRFWH